MKREIFVFTYNFINGKIIKIIKLVKQVIYLVLSYFEIAIFISNRPIQFILIYFQ